MWVYDHTSELYHYGVPGMKWGVRRAIRRSARADRRISKINKDRSTNKAARKAADKDANYRFKGNEKKLRNAKALNKAKFELSETENKYKLAKQKAKKDKNYKKSKEYIQAKNAYANQSTEARIYGKPGQLRIQTLKNKGYTDNMAKGMILTEKLLLSVGLLGVSLGLTKKRG